MKKTPLYDRHVALNARMMPFGGFEMPVQYSGIVDEHLAVRQCAGLFDVSHMGEFIVEGERAFEFVQKLVTNDASRLDDGRAMYTVMCDENGGIIDDLIVYRLRKDRYMLVVNAANIEPDYDWITSRNEFGADLRDVSAETALLALQGPEAFEVAQAVTEVPLSGIKYYHFMEVPNGAFLGSEHTILSHTGYTGEQGLEIYCEASLAGHIWDELLSAGRERGLKPAGLGARDTLRIEAGYSLYGSDIDRTTNPIEAGLGWVTKLEKGDFIGADALRAVKEKGPERRLVTFVVEDRAIPRSGYRIRDPQNGDDIGQVTSGTQSPILNKGIGLGYVTNEPRYTQPGSSLILDVRGKSIRTTVKKPPLHK